MKPISVTRFLLTPTVCVQSNFSSRVGPRAHKVSGRIQGSRPEPQLLPPKMPHITPPEGSHPLDQTLHCFKNPCRKETVGQQTESRTLLSLNPVEFEMLSREKVEM